MNEIILYTSPDGVTKLEVHFEDETFWLTQRRIAELFGVSVPTVSEHLTAIFDSGELDRQATIRKFRRVQIEGGREVERDLDHYSLDAIIAVGYRVNSKQATQFRIWATNTLKEYVIKGFVLDDERLKLHWAVSGKTAAEIIAERADASKPTMGLTTWKNAPHGKVLKGDITTAKNYLIEKEIKDLERIVTMYLDYAELQASRQVPMKMADWVERLNAFLQFNGFEVLDNPGKVSAEVAKKLAEEEYEKFRVKQDEAFESDFEREAKRLEGGRA